MNDSDDLATLVTETAGDRRSVPVKVLDGFVCYVRRAADAFYVSKKGVLKEIHGALTPQGGEGLLLITPGAMVLDAHIVDDDLSSYGCALLLESAKVYTYYHAGLTIGYVASTVANWFS